MVHSKKKLDDRFRKLNIVKKQNQKGRCRTCVRVWGMLMGRK